MSRTVLIADESITIRSVAESLLRGESFSVHSAADGNMALEVAASERPDLALIGEKLAGLGGAEVCRAIKSNPDLNSMPIIFMRADRPGPTPEHIDAVLTKPFSPQSLLDAVHRFLASEVGRESTSPVAISAPVLADPGLEEELIDQALGLDDVGSAPAEERNIAAGRSPVGLDLPDASTQEVARPFGLIDDSLAPESTSELEDVNMNKALDESFGFEAPSLSRSVPPVESNPGEELEFESLNTREPDDDVDMALDAAFGERPSGGRNSPAQIPGAAPDHPKSSLQEVSLGESTAPPRPDRLAPSSAAPGGGIDLGGADDVADDRPHDYDWFIKEMQQEPGTLGSSRPHHEPPKIEPLPLSPAKRSDRTPSGSTPAGPSSKSGRSHPHKAYDEFISEFRAEIAKIEGMATSPAPSRKAEREDQKKSGPVHLPMEAAGEISRPHQEPPASAVSENSIRAWGDALINTITEQVAKELAAKIDSKAIYALIEQKLKDAQKRQP